MMVPSSTQLEAVAATAVVSLLLMSSVEAFSSYPHRSTFGSIQSVSLIPSSSSCITVPPGSTCRLWATAADGGEDDPTVDAPQEGQGEDIEEITSTGNAAAEAADGAADILNSPAFLKRKIEVLKTDIANTETEIEAAKKRLEVNKEEWAPQLEYLDREFKSIQERMNTRSEQGDTVATMEVARKMLDVLDNYDRAFGAITAETEEQKTIEAEYLDTREMILSAFNKLGVEEIETVGAEFDYEVHQAVMQKVSDEFEEGVVCEELQKGFKIGETLIRAAMVAVAA